MTLTLTLPDSLKPFLESRVSEGGLGDLNAYLVSLIDEERRRQGEEDAAVLPLLQEALDGPPATPMTAEDWDWIRREARDRLADRAR